MAKLTDLRVRKYIVPVNLPKNANGWIDNWNSNMRAGAPIQFAGFEFHTVENAYQASKFEGPAAASEFVNLSPTAAKRHGRDCKFPLRANWEEVCVAAMYSFNCQKWKAGTQFGINLLSAAAPFVEWTNWGRSTAEFKAISLPGDRRWGVGASQLNDGVGRNALGLIHHLIHNALIEERVRIQPSADPKVWPELQDLLIETMNKLRW